MAAGKCVLLALLGRVDAGLGQHCIGAPPSSTCSDRPPRTAVISAVVGYPWVRYAVFTRTLRSHYNGDIIYLTAIKRMPTDIRQLCDQERVKLQELSAHGCNIDLGLANHRICPSITVTRWVPMADACEPYELCLSIDVRDVFFQADPFSNLLTPDGYRKHDMVFVQEEAKIGDSFWNRRWAAQCYGHGQLRLLQRARVINAGAIYATAAGFRTLAESLTAPCPATNATFHGIDQTILNWLVHGADRGSRRLGNLTYTAQPHGRGNVICLHYLKAAARIRAMNITSKDHANLRQRTRSNTLTNDDLRSFPRELPFRVYNLDGTLSPAVHQYDVDPWLMVLLDKAALATYNHSTSLSNSDGAATRRHGRRVRVGPSTRD